MLNHVDGANAAGQASTGMRRMKRARLCPLMRPCFGRAGLRLGNTFVSPYMYRDNTRGSEDLELKVFTRMYEVQSSRKRAVWPTDL